MFNDMYRFMPRGWQWLPSTIHNQHCNKLIVHEKKKKKNLHFHHVLLELSTTIYNIKQLKIIKKKIKLMLEFNFHSDPVSLRARTWHSYNSCCVDAQHRFCDRNFITYILYQRVISRYLGSSKTSSLFFPIIYLLYFCFCYLGSRLRFECIR